MSSTFYRTRCGWNALLPARAACSLPPPQRHHDAIVVGAGYTGLSAARRLASLRPDFSILLLEADVVGEGSSGRNAGFAVSVPFNSPLNGAVLSAAERAQLQSYERGLGELESLVRTHGIDCGWNLSPKLHAAATVDGERRLRAQLRSYRRWGIDHEEWDRSQIRHATGTGHYRYGFRTGRNVFVQPAALVRGLADSMPANVHLMENTPVLRVQAQGKPVVHTPAGAFSSDRLLLANNAFIKRLGFLRERIVTIYTYAALTPTLTPDQHHAAGNPHGGAEWGILPANRLGTTVRLVAGQRLLFRSAYSYEKELPAERVRQLLLATYRRRFPDMPGGHAFEFVWGGTTALTSNGEASFGPLAPGVFGFAGCNGSGIVKGSVYGRLLAELSLNVASDELASASQRAGPGYMPPEPFRAIGAHTAIAYQAWRAGAER